MRRKLRFISGQNPSAGRACPILQHRFNFAAAFRQLLFCAEKLPFGHKNGRYFPLFGA